MSLNWNFGKWTVVALPFATLMPSLAMPLAVVFAPCWNKVLSDCASIANTSIFFPLLEKVFWSDFGFSTSNHPQISPRHFPQCLLSLAWMHCPWYQSAIALWMILCFLFSNVCYIYVHRRACLSRPSTNTKKKKRPSAPFTWSPELVPFKSTLSSLASILLPPLAESSMYSKTYIKTLTEPKSQKK